MGSTPGERAPRKHREWLRDELPELVDAGVLDRAAARRLSSHYGLAKLRARGSLRALALALFGCSMVGAGVILLFAHNWGELSRPTRAAVSLGQLLIAQAITGYAVVRRARSRAFIEGTAALLAFSIAAAIALVAQTYNLGGELSDFTLVWIALTLPMLYVQKARIVATFVLLAAPVIAFERAHEVDRGLTYFPIVAAVIPALRLRAFASKLKGLTLLSRWAFVITVPVAVAGLLIEPFEPSGSWPLVMAGLAGTFVALGARLEHAHQTGLMRRAFSIGGSLGAIGLLLTLGYQPVVDDLLADFVKGQSLAKGAGYVLSFLAIGTASALAPAVFGHGRREGASRALLASMAAVVLLYAGLRAGMSSAAVAIGAGLVTLALGLALLALGIRERATATSNQGLGVLALLLVARFFDTEWSFLARGLAFLLLGLAFLAVNVILSRKQQVPA